MPRAFSLQSRADPVDCPDSQLIGYNLAITSLPSDPAVASVASPNRDNKFDSTLVYNGNIQHQHANSLLKNNCQHYNAKSHNLASAVVLHDDKVVVHFHHR